MSGILNMGNNKITNLGNPTLSTDAANLSYCSNASNLTSGTVNKDRLPLILNTFGMNDQQIHFRLSTDNTHDGL